MRADEGDLTVGVIGLGYVGLPTAIGFHDAGFNVWGVDISQRTVDMVKRGENPTGDPDVNDIIPAPGTDRWNITTSTTEAVPHCDVILVTVPTPVTEDLKPDLSYVQMAGRAVFESLNKGSRTIVVLESTVYPGVTSHTWLPEIEELGLEIGVDVEIAYCPERFNPGDPAHGVRQVASVIGCSNPDVGAGLVGLYSRLTVEDVRYVGKLEVAEAAKVIENVQRDINIALVNELAIILPKLGVDIEDVLEAASSKWNFHRYTPGLGVGGHCIPVDPYFLIDQAQLNNSPVNLISSGRKINSSMPSHVASEIRGILQKFGIPIEGAKILILGWSYKPGIGDDRGSPSRELSIELYRLGVQIFCLDPYVDESSFPKFVTPISDFQSSNHYDMLVVATAHNEFMGLNWDLIKNSMQNPILYDSRRCLQLLPLEKMGWNVFALGKPESP